VTENKTYTKAKQFQDKTGDLMMLPADMAFIADPEFAKWVKLYAQDEKVFFQDFAQAFSKLLELGVVFPGETVKKGGSSGGQGGQGEKKEEKKGFWKRIFG